MFKKMLSPFIEEYSPMIWVMLMLIVIVAVFAPLLVIQALNILFGLSIPEEDLFLLIASIKFV